MGRIVGILGGMGPLATADLYRKIVLATPARCDQEHLHIVIEADPSVPDRSAFLQGHGPDPFPALTRGAARLAAAGADFIAIPCNTAHAFLPQLRTRVATPFLDMIAETAARVSADYPRVRRVGILATAGTIGTGLYHAALRDRGLEPLHPDAAGQALVGAAIAAIKAGDTGAAVGGRLVEASRALIADGAEVLLAACTELPLVLTPAMLTVPLLDPTQILAEAAVREGRAAPVAGGTR
ncbi:MAG: Aspartate racemase [uncultured Thermomicrobiales bacterium]|uniref:Aspartate racemase n=1 Tax=uncultured Thermomicrobiales bacterium TaxID=1645740 RepID=A0A6J4VS14_9BACT|nr:MAG: Aspartate racemase [uncultured Thermomicrobiales bacterium]